MSKKEIAADLGYIGMVAEATTIVLMVFIGVTIDTFGRKGLLVIGVLVAGVTMGLLPITNIYPGFLICRVLMSLGITIAQNIPLLPDYV